MGKCYFPLKPMNWSARVARIRKIEQSEFEAFVSMYLFLPSLSIPVYFPHPYLITTFCFRNHSQKLSILGCPPQPVHQAFFLKSHSFPRKP